MNKIKLYLFNLSVWWYRRKIFKKIKIAINAMGYNEFEDYLDSKAYDNLKRSKSQFAKHICSLVDKRKQERGY